MELIQGIKERRSVRKYKDETVPKEVLEEIVEIARYAPSWANLQIARYNFVEDKEIIKRLANEAVNDFVYNNKTLLRASGVMVLSYVTGKSGKKEEVGLEQDSEMWEAFDSGIACQTFCLAAYGKGVDTLIMGVIENEKISQIIGLPEGEKVAALVVYGYSDNKDQKVPPRKTVEELSRFL